jgi:hypothetical protein
MQVVTVRVQANNIIYSTKHMYSPIRNQRGFLGGTHTLIIGYIIMRHH